MDQVILRKTALAMQPTSPAFPPGPYRFVDREYFIIGHRTDPQALRRVVPEPLEIIEPVVNHEFIRMPDSTGFGDYTARWFRSATRPVGRLNPSATGDVHELGQHLKPR